MSLVSSLLKVTFFTYLQHIHSLVIAEKKVSLNKIHIYNMVLQVSFDTEHYKDSRGTGREYAKMLCWNKCMEVTFTGPRP